MSDPHSESDSTIIDRSVVEPALFAVLVDRYQLEFTRKVRKIVGNDEDAKDIVQDTFVKVYLNAKKYKVRQDATARAWMYKILLNTCFTFCKKRKRERHFLEYADPADIDLIAVSEDREKMLDLDRIAIALTKLPQTFSNLITQTLIKGKTYEDIAREEGVAEGVLRTRMHRAKKELRKVLHTYGE